MEIKSKSDIHAFIEQFSFGIVVSDDLTATHLPFLLKKDEGEYGTLYGHFASANSHYKTLSDQAALIIFNGPHAYISPTWYATAPAVPTWNYSAVHAYGVLTLTSDDETLSIINDTVTKYEPNLHNDTTTLSDEFKSKLLKGIVGFKVELSKLEGKHKLGQHRKVEDQQGVYHALNQSSRPDDQALASYMQQLTLGIGE